MKLAIDADEVLVRYLENACAFYNDVWSSNGHRFSERDFGSFSFQDTFGIDAEEDRTFMRAHVKSDYFKRMRLVDGAKMGVSKLAESCDLFVVTARESEALVRTCCYFYKGFPGVFSGVYLCSGDKADFCKGIGVNTIIEDSPSVTRYADAGMNVVLLDKPWNEGIEHSRIQRCSDWTEIVDAVGVLNGGG